MAKAKHQAKKTKVNIGTIGHVDYGKTTLIDAIINAQFHNVGTEVKKHNQNQNLIPEIHIEIERGKEQKVAKGCVNNVGVNLSNKDVVSSEILVLNNKIIFETCSKKEQEEEELE